MLAKEIRTVTITHAAQAMADGSLSAMFLRSYAEKILKSNFKSATVKNIRTRFLPF